MYFANITKETALNFLASINVFLVLSVYALTNFQLLNYNFQLTYCLLIYSELNGVFLFENQQFTT